MIDYLIVFPDAAARDAAYPAPEDNPPTWEVDGLSIMPVNILIADAVVNEEMDVVTPAVFAPGSWVAVRAAERDETVEAMENCMLATDGSLAAQEKPYVYFCRLQPDTIIGQVSPVFAGDAYVIQAGQPASVLYEWLITE